MDSDSELDLSLPLYQAHCTWSGVIVMDATCRREEVGSHHSILDHMSVY